MRAVFKYLLPCFILIGTVRVQSDTKYDSLLLVINNGKTADTLRLQAMYDMAGELLYTNPDSALLLSNQIIDLSASLKNTKWEASGNTLKGVVLYLTSNYSDAIAHHEKALSINRRRGNENGIAASLNNLGIVYQELSNFSKSLEYFLESLKISEKLNDHRLMAIAYGNIGTCYKGLQQPETSLQYHFKSLALEKKLKNKRGEAESLSAIADYYFDKTDYSTAVKYLLQSLELQTEIGSHYGMAGCYNDLALNYTYLDEYDKARQYFFKSIELYKQIDDQHGEALSLIGLGDVFYRERRLKEALVYAKKGYELALNSSGVRAQREAVKLLSDTYKLTGDYKSAMHYYETYVALRDSINNEEINKSTYRLELKYEYEKKTELAAAEQAGKDAVIAAERRRQKLVLVSVSGGLFLTLLLTMVIFRSLRINKRKNQIITEQKFLVEKQKQTVEEKQKEILDSIYYARRIQESLLPKEKYINKVLKEAKS